MPKKLVRQFKTQATPAKTRGYRPLGHGVEFRNPTKGGSVYVGKYDDPGLKEHAEGARGQLKTDTTVGGGGLGNYTLGQLLYQQQLGKPIPLPQPSTNMPIAVDPRDYGYAPQQPTLVQPTAIATNIQPPVQRPVGYRQPNVGVDITPEQFTLPPPQQRILQERPYDPFGEPPMDYGPITTPIPRPIQEEAGNIEPIEPYDLTPGPQVTATEQAFYEPQPIESAYAYPIQADYTQPQPQDIPQDDITNIIDSILPEIETLEAKTLDIPQEGPQWVEDPQALAAQELIDQADFTQTDPSLINLGMPPTIAEAPEIAYTQPQQEDPYIIDYSDTYGEPTLPQQELPQVFTPELVVEQPSITQPPELGMPEIPVTPTVDDDLISVDDIRAGLGTTEEIPLPTSESIGITPEIIQPPIGANPMVEATITSNPDLVVPIVDDTLVGGTTTGMENLPPGGKIEDYHLENQLEVGRGNIDEYVGGPIERDPGGAAEIAEVLRQQKEGQEFKGDPAVTTDITGGVDTSYPGVDAVEDEGGRGTITVQEAAEAGITEQPEFPSQRKPTLGAETQPTQPTIPSGEETGIQEGAMTSLPGQGQWLYTGPQGYAESRWITSGQKQGPPIISETPAVSGPQVIRDPVTGKSTIVDQPLTWWANRLGYDFNQNAPLPTGKPGMISGQGFGTGTGTGTTTGAQEPPDITGISPFTPTGKGGEGRTPLQTFLEGQDNAGRLIPGGLNLDATSLKHTAAINQLRSSYTAKDFDGINSVEKLGNFFGAKEGFQGFGNSIANVIQELTGMEDGDLKGPGLWNTLNTPIPAFSTGEFGITPLDIITVIAGGTVAIGPVLIRKFMDSLMQPFASAVTKGLKGVFSTVFKRGGDIFRREQEVSQEDISAYELAGLANSLGISAPAGTIKAGTYYDAGGNVLATNMKPLDFGLHTVDGANAFKDVLHDIAVKIDPNYKTTFYHTRTGQIDIVHADGTTTENASYITTDSEGNMSQGTSANKKTSKKVKWGVNVIGVESIDTVAPRKDKGKGKGKGGRSIWDWIKDTLGGGDDDDDDDDDDIPPSGN